MSLFARPLASTQNGRSVQHPQEHPSNPHPTRRPNLIQGDQIDDFYNEQEQQRQHHIHPQPYDDHPHYEQYPPIHPGQSPRHQEQRSSDAIFYKMFAEHGFPKYPSLIQSDEMNDFYNEMDHLQAAGFSMNHCTNKNASSNTGGGSSTTDNSRGENDQYELSNRQVQTSSLAAQDATVNGLPTSTVGGRKALLLSRM